MFTHPRDMVNQFGYRTSSSVGGRSDSGSMAKTIYLHESGYTVILARRWGLYRITIVPSTGGPGKPQLSCDISKKTAEEELQKKNVTSSPTPGEVGCAIDIIWDNNSEIKAKLTLEGFDGLYKVVIIGVGN